ncbi:MAG TPA: hypothetical protein VN655_04340 [Pseudolabrys sp.]|nr:hypothetical protein [Pseudolabrys sp.]
MKRLSLLLFLALLPVSSFFALTKINELPGKIAIHFDVSGAPDAWIDRDYYRILVIGSLIALPLLIVWLMGWLPRLIDGKGQVPNSEYWFAQERRPSTESFLIGHASWLGCFSVAVIYGVHVLIAGANLVNPPHLDSDRLITVLVIYLVGLSWWIATFMRRFQRVDRNG